MNIILNGQNTNINLARLGHDSLTYEQIVAMVYQPTVTFAHGPKSKPDGILHRGQSIRVSEGMVINCIVTGAA